MHTKINILPSSITWLFCQYEIKITANLISKFLTDCYQYLNVLFSNTLDKLKEQQIVNITKTIGKEEHSFYCLTMSSRNDGQTISV